MKLKTTIAAAAAGSTLLLGGCETTDWNTVGSLLSLYSDISYINGDCPYGLHKWYDRDGVHHCSLDDDHPSYNHRNDHHGGHHDEPDESSAAN